jgi:hypothetical protein
MSMRRSPSLIIGVPAEWARLCGLWYERSTAVTSHRNKSYYFLLNVGRWLAHDVVRITAAAGTLKSPFDPALRQDHSIKDSQILRGCGLFCPHPSGH